MPNLRTRISAFLNPFGVESKMASAPISGGSVWGGYGLNFGSWGGLGGSTPTVADGPTYSNVVVAASIGWISRNFPTAALKVVTYDGTEDGEAIPDHAAIALLDKPNPIDDFNSFWASFCLSDVVDGNTFIIKIRNGGGGIHSLWWVPPWNVEIVPNDGPDNAERPIAEYKVSVSGKQTNYPPANVIHIKDGRDPNDPYRGLSPLKAAGLRSVSTVDRSELYTQTLMGNCGAISGVLSPSNATETIDPDNIPRIHSQFSENQTGRNNGRPIVSSQGMRFDKLALSPEEMALDKIRDFPVASICTLIGIPAMVIGFPDTQKTYSNYGEALRAAWDNVLIPRQARAAEAFDRQCAELILPGQRMVWDYQNVTPLQDDWNAKVDSITKATGGAFMSKNEGRAMVHLDPKEGGDDVREPMPPPIPGQVPGEKPKPGGKPVPPDPKADEKPAKAGEGEPETKMSPPRYADDETPPDDELDTHEDNTYGLPDGGPLRRALKRFYGKQFAEVLGEIPEIGAPLPDVFESLADYDDPMASAMTPIISSYWDWAGQRTLGKLGLDPGAWSVIDPNVHQMIADATLAFCASTNATTTKVLNDALADLRRELQEGIVDHGESIPQLRKRVQSIFGEMSKTKADQIARTETSRAVHAASLKSAADSGVVEGKAWLLSSNACPLCHELAEKSKGGIPLDSSFGVIGTNPTYSDVRFPPGHPGCRCTTTLVLKQEFRDMIAAETGKPAPEDVAALDPKSKPIKRKPARV